MKRFPVLIIFLEVILFSSSAGCGGKPPMPNNPDPLDSELGGSFFWDKIEEVYEYNGLDANGNSKKIIIKGMMATTKYQQNHVWNLLLEKGYVHYHNERDFKEEEMELNNRYYDDIFFAGEYLDLDKSKGDKTIRIKRPSVMGNCHTFALSSCCSSVGKWNYWVDEEAAVLEATNSVDLEQLNKNDILFVSGENSHSAVVADVYEIGKVKTLVWKYRESGIYEYQTDTLVCPYNKEKQLTVNDLYEKKARRSKK